MNTKKLNEITRHFTNDLDDDVQHQSMSLMSGRSGTILFFLELYKSTGDSFYKEQIGLTLACIDDVLEKSGHLSATYCDGLAGWGWVLEVLKEEGLITEEYDDILGDMDDILGEEINKMMDDQNYDLLHGALGLGLYFLKRKNNAICEKIVLNLDSLAIIQGSEIRFVRHDILNLKADIYDLSMPHGMVGILYYLGKCYEQHILPEICERLIFGGVNFFYNNRQDEGTIGSYFPNGYMVGSYKSGANPSSCSRMAWCYGDLTILYTLFNLTRLLNHAELEHEILNMLHGLCSRKDPLITAISDATFCHGSTGAAYFFLKLYKLTGSDLFDDASLYWLDQTLAYGHTDGFAGYQFEMSSSKEKRFTPSSGILEGIGGIGLMMSAFENKNSRNSWDECLFFS